VKKFSFLLAMLALALALGLTFVGCDNGANDSGTIYYQLYWNEGDSELNISFWGAETTREQLTDNQKAAVDTLVPSDITIHNNGGGNLAPAGDRLNQNIRTDVYGKKLSTTGSKSGENNKITIKAKSGFTFAEYSTDNTF